jgi:hypothetical protein
MSKRKFVEGAVVLAGSSYVVFVTLLYLSERQKKTFWEERYKYLLKNYVSPERLMDLYTEVEFENIVKHEGGA